jgi:hypothetical protein
MKSAIHGSGRCMDQRTRNRRGSPEEENMGSWAAAAEGGGGCSARGWLTGSGRRRLGWWGVEGGKVASVGWGAGRSPLRLPSRAVEEQEIEAAWIN